MGVDRVKYEWDYEKFQVKAKGVEYTIKKINGILMNSDNAFDNDNTPRISTQSHNLGESAVRSESPDFTGIQFSKKDPSLPEPIQRRPSPDSEEVNKYFPKSQGSSSGLGGKSPQVLTDKNSLLPPFEHTLPTSKNWIQVKEKLLILKINSITLII